MMTIQKYVRAQSLSEAYELNQNKRNAIVGGMLWLRVCNARIDTAIDLSLLGLDEITEDDDNFYIGAMVTLRALQKHAALNEYCNGIVSDAVKDIVGVQFRNLATVGGSIFGRYGFSDVLTAFLAMDARVELYNRGEVTLKEFSDMKKDRDILVRLIVPKGNKDFSYLALRNSRTDFPVLCCAVSQVDGRYRAVVGARPGRAVVIEDTGILSGELSEDKIEQFAEYVADNTAVSGNIRGSAEYRKHLAKILTRRNLECRLV